MARRLTSIAKWINERTDLLGLKATTRPSRSSTDRKIPGSRLRHPGKGRTGTRLEVVSYRGDRFVLDNSQTYRMNDEAAAVAAVAAVAAAEAAWAAAVAAAVAAAAAAARAEAAWDRIVMALLDAIEAEVASAEAGAR